jgi:hypothetical protein
MPWPVETLGTIVDDEIAALPKDMQPHAIDLDRSSRWLVKWWKPGRRQA